MVSINLKRADLPIKWHFTSWLIWCHSHWIKSNWNVIPFPEQIPLQGLTAQKCLTLCWLPRGLSRKLGVPAGSAELLPCWTQPSLLTSGSTEMPRYLLSTPARALSNIWRWTYTSESDPGYTNKQGRVTTGKLLAHCEKALPPGREITKWYTYPMVGRWCSILWTMASPNQSNFTPSGLGSQKTWHQILALLTDDLGPVTEPIWALAK